MKVRYSKAGGWLAGVYQATMLALYLVAESSQEDTADRFCFLLATLLTFPWSFVLLPFTWMFPLPLTLLYAVFTAVNAFGLYKIGNSITLGVDE